MNEISSVLNFLLFMDGEGQRFDKSKILKLLCDHLLLHEFYDKYLDVKPGTRPSETRFPDDGTTARGAKLSQLESDCGWLPFDSRCLERF